MARKLVSSEIIHDVTVPGTEVRIVITHERWEVCREEGGVFLPRNVYVVELLASGWHGWPDLKDVFMSVRNQTLNPRLRAQLCAIEWCELVRSNTRF